MSDDEIKKLDWQVLTARLLMENDAIVRTMMENQAFIISKITDIPLADIIKQMNEHLKQNNAKTEEITVRDIPKYTH